MHKANAEKEDLIRQEADRMMTYHNPTGDYSVNLTVAHGVLIPAAGIDESNADNHYILWPRNIDEFCREVRERLMKKHKLKKLGIIVTDSHTTPLRWGVTGLTIGLAGVEPLMDIRGKQDLFGREMHLTQVDMIDPLAAMAGNVMGENDECTPIVIMRGDLKIEYSNTASMENFKIDPDYDLYRPLLDALPEVEH